LRAVAGQYRDQGQFDKAIASSAGDSGKNYRRQAELAYTYQLAGKPQEAADLYIRLAKSAKGNLGLDLSAAQALVAPRPRTMRNHFWKKRAGIDANNYRLHAIQGSIAEADNRFADARMSTISRSAIFRNRFRRARSIPSNCA
jgi:multidrug efflux pump subunit AcrA (membrane-fusion protein)